MGPLPQYFPIWLHSCSYNPEVKFLLFGSHLPAESPVENVELIPLTLEQFCKRASASTGVSVKVASPKKICDFKPAFGQIFREYLESSDFWGYCDLDVVWGDLGPLTSDEILGASDVISVRGDRFLSGACTFYRNTNSLCTLYRRSPTWKRVFTDPNHWAFDEDFGRGEVRPLDDLRRRSDPVSMLDIAFHEIKQGRFSFYTPEPPYVLRELKPEFEFTLEWNEGTLVEQGRGEVFGYHLIFAKNAPFFRIADWAEIPSSFVIDSRGIYASSSNMLAYETIRLGKGAFNWTRKVVTRKAQNARSKLFRYF